MVKNSDIAWLAGIVDGEGCFSVKMPVVRGRGRHCHQVWLVICNTSKAMIDRATDIMCTLGIKRPTIRRVWKGKKATCWQYWVNLCGKEDLLLVTEALLPHLTAKRVEAEVVAWFLRRACMQRAYKRTALDKAALESLSAVKRNGGEVPAEVEDLLRAIIPSQAFRGTDSATSGLKEGVETRRMSPSNTSAQEPPAPSTRAVGLKVVI
jgi:hypothetical protein